MWKERNNSIKWKEWRGKKKSLILFLRNFQKSPFGFRPVCILRPRWANAPSLWLVWELCPPSPTSSFSPRINYRVSVTADGSPTLPCSQRCILGERQVQPKLVCERVCIYVWDKLWNMLKRFCSCEVIWYHPNSHHSNKHKDKTML